MDATIGNGRIALDEKGPYIAGSRDYVWFADSESNEDYRRPGRYVCFMPPWTYWYFLHPADKYDKGGRCSMIPLVKMAIEGQSGLTLVARDGDEDRWAIVDISYPLSQHLYQSD